MATRPRPGTTRESYPGMSAADSRKCERCPVLMAGAGGPLCHRCRAEATVESAFAKGAKAVEAAADAIDRAFEAGESSGPETATGPR